MCCSPAGLSDSAGHGGVLIILLLAPSSAGGGGAWGKGRGCGRANAVVQSMARGMRSLVSCILIWVVLELMSCVKIRAVSIYQVAGSEASKYLSEELASIS